MTTPRAIFYRLDLGHLPAGADACARQALKHWEKTMKGALRFVEDEDLADWHFQFAEVETFPKHSAWCYATDATRRLILFDPRETWKITLWQRMFGRKGWDLRAIAMHEIGHAFGLRHSVDPSSIMHPKTKTVKIDPAYVAAVLERLNLK